MQKEARAEPEKKGRGREMYEWVQALVCSVLAVVLVFTFGARLIGVDGHSMVPTLQDGDRLLVLNSMLCGGYEPGDIVVLRKESFLPTPSSSGSSPRRARWWTSILGPAWSMWTENASMRTISTS